MYYIYHIHSDDADVTAKKYENKPCPYTTAFQHGRILLKAMDKNDKIIYNFEDNIIKDDQTLRLKQAIKVSKTPSLQRKKTKKIPKKDKATGIFSPQQSLYAQCPSNVTPLKQSILCFDLNIETKKEETKPSDTKQTKTNDTSKDKSTKKDKSKKRDKSTKKDKSQKKDKSKLRSKSKSKSSSEPSKSPSVPSKSPSEPSKSPSVPPEQEDFPSPSVSPEASEGKDDEKEEKS